MPTRQPKTATKTTKQPTHKQAVIITTKQAHPDLTTREIAAIANTDHTHVIKTLQRYGIDREQVDKYKNCRADILAGLQERLLSSITDADVQKTPAIQRITGAAILYDKERLERGQSTDNVSVLVAGIRDLQARRNAEKADT